MLLSEAGYVFIGFILYVSGAQRQQKTVCALKGSTVHLFCSAERPTSSNKWYTVHQHGSEVVLNELFADRSATSNMSEDGNFTLTIRELRENDAKFYCCTKNKSNRQKCWQSAVKIQVTDLQVKVIPTTEDQTVTLVCSTSCPLTENPAPYIWYRNGEFLYEDWSPWYQELVSSEEGVTYSCAIKGYEDLRAPEVSVDSVTSTCFTVTYTKGKSCSYQQKSENKPCSITYPREVHVQKTPAELGHVKLTCNISCSQTDDQTAFRWYKNRQYENEQLFLVPSSSNDIFSCAVNGHEDLMSAEVCEYGPSYGVKNKNCWSVDYVSRRICALQGFSVNISSKYSQPEKEQRKFWYKIKRRDQVEAEKLTTAAGRVEYHDNMKNQHILSISQLKRNDSADYIFRVLTEKDGKESHFPVVTLVVTDLRLRITPSAVVTEGQRVTLTCSTRCPLTDNIHFIWLLNSEPLTLPENQNKHLVLDPVSSQHEGRYSCFVKISKKRIMSSELTLTVRSITRQQVLTATGVVAVLLVITLSVFLWIRRKKTLHQSPRAETSDNMEQINSGHVYDDISVQPANQDDLQYSEVHFCKNQKVPLYSTIQQSQPQEQEPYSVVHFTPIIRP